jgi:UDP-N-acetylmuramoyl-L-alanyl-D-glutamate--2,6-diaminopimelate ligase
MSVKAAIRKVTPRWVLGLYHFCLAQVAAACYGFPGRRLVVVGVTGTKGKSTTCAMVWHVLHTAGFRVGLVTTAQLSSGGTLRLNDLKMTMPSPFWLQRFLRDMVSAGCTHAVVETSSEGLAQWRHLGLNYQVAVLTNLAPEHLEAHGSYESYRAAKGKLFKLVGERGGITIVNLDDAEAPYFLAFPAAKRFGYSLNNSGFSSVDKAFRAEVQEVTQRLSRFTVDGQEVLLPVGGQFNVYNALAALATTSASAVPLEKSVAALKNFPGTPGRLEFVATEPFNVVVDYAHTPESLEAVYQTLKSSSGRLIAVLGSCGGGRDKAKREPLGRLAGRFADIVIVTDEDPYDEDPISIMQAVAKGALSSGKHEGENLWVVTDRRAAIKKALALSKAGDTVVITGKGAEQWLCVAGNKKIPWDDRTIAKELLQSLAS